MPVWTGDGLMMGYSPADDRLEQNTYRFATNGSVDLNAVTRLQYDLPSGVNATNFPNRLSMKIPMRITTADFEAHPSAMGPDATNWLGVAAVAVKANAFPSGTTPTPQQIYNKWIDTNGLWANSDKQYQGGWGTGLEDVSRTWTINGWTTGYFDPGTKYWVLVLPVFYGPIKPFRVFNNINLNSVGRAVSFWTNRRPAKPTITSPPNNTVVGAGSVINLTVQPNDPDSVGAADRYDRDLSALWVQYAPLPTPDNPSPEWTDMYYRVAGGDTYYADISAWSTHVTSGSGLLTPLNNRGFPLKVGGAFADPDPGQGAVPSGAWQIRVKVGDTGHPYPRLQEQAVGKPGGIWYTKTMPDANVSPWSDPVCISVFQQVPPPIPLAPKDGIAIADDDTVRLSWLYRNTAEPPDGPYDQEYRSVQIRAVGETDWHWIVSEQASSDTWLDLPPGSEWDPANEPIAPPAEYLTDGTFEAGTLGGWQTNIPGYIETEAYPENVTGTAGAGVHTGTHALRINTDDVVPDPDLPGFYFPEQLYLLGDTPVDPSHNSFTVDVWVRANADLGSVLLTAGWLDSSGDLLGGVVGSEEAGAVQSVEVVGPFTTPTWVHLTLPPVRRLSGAEYPLIIAGATSADPTYATPIAENIRLDDASVMMQYTPFAAPLKLEAITEYEWRVKVIDASFADDNRSDWSQPARFWIVPGTDSGVEKPVPESTIDGATLGCGTHRVFVYRRGGIERVGELRGLTHVDWGRLRDDISTAKIVVQDWDVDCSELLKRLQAWAYEIVIYRDNGYSVDRVWEGPITLLTYERDSVTISAKDVIGYAYRRIIKQKMDDTGDPEVNTTAGDTVVHRARRAIQNAFAADDPNILSYLTPIENASDAQQYRSIPAYSRTVFEEIDDMAANAGLDYVAVGRRILLWGTKSRIGTLPEFRDENLGASPIVSEYGMSMANNYSVSDGNGIHGEANRLDVSGNDPIYGLVEMLSSTWASDATEDTGTYTQEGIATVIESFEEYAERSISDRYPPPVVVRVPDNTTLNPNTVLSINQLVPGVVIPLRSTGTLRTVEADQKLDSITVTEEAGKETITVVMSPFSRDDADAGEGGEES